MEEEAHKKRIEVEEQQLYDLKMERSHKDKKEKLELQILELQRDQLLRQNQRANLDFDAF